MKLRNKKTGEIKVFALVRANNDIDDITLAELNEEWEDYEEPKDEDYWYIEDLGKVNFSSELLDKVAGTPNNILIYKILGNYFETKEEAEKAVEKLKAWKRLKDKGFKFIGVRAIGKVIDFDMPTSYHSIAFGENTNDEDALEFYNDLNFVFGGENE